MREIKFRVWDGHTKSFFCTEGTHYLPKLECDIDGILTITPIDNSYQIMQSTGLKDKNGVEIYEGDVVKAIDVISSVEWSNDGFWEIAAPGTAEPTLLGNHTGVAEVIGNIYEHGHLLEEHGK